MRHDAPLDLEGGEAQTPSHVDDVPHRYDYGYSSATGRRALWWIVAVLVLGALAAAGYYYWSQRTGAPAPADALPPRAATESAPPVQAEPAIQHPIEAAKPETAIAALPGPAAPLPALEASDPGVADALAGVLDRGAIDEYLNATGFVRRVVATVDNLPRKKAPQRLWPVKPTAGAFLTTGGNEAAYLDPENARRYEPFLRVMESVDTGKLVAVYVRFYPLFQQAYRELGYPKGYFNDRLVEVIDHLLVTPELDGPVRLAKPWILHEFADPALEARSAGQKTLVRMGTANALRVKAKLREFRRQIAGRAMKQ